MSFLCNLKSYSHLQKSHLEYDISIKYKYNCDYTCMSKLYSTFAASNNRLCDKNRY